ncbi:MAG: deoxyribonuclease IV [Phycisphaerales bacterium]|nr:deoxyribonuclease IV [Phycisphaerales bacterium]
MYGSHLSVAGGMVNALDEAARLRLDCVQVFTKNQRQWSSRPLDEDAVRAWHTRRRELGWHRKRPRGRVVSHNSYLINLASPDPAAWRRSIDVQRIEMERCETLDIPFLVAHPGAHLGDARPTGTPHDLDAPPTKAERAGLTRIARALDRLHADLPGLKVVTCLETTVGSGSNLGYAFHHLAFIRDAVAAPDRVGFCLDTCHVTAAGYDMTTDDRAAAVLRLFNKTCGVKHLHVVHVNDSVGAVGSRKDRHAHIGEGCCGRSCFRAIVNHPRLRTVPKILETPKGEGPGGHPWDVINVRRLKRLEQKSDRSGAAVRSARASS